MALTSHVGSLPFLDIDEALDYTFKFDIPVIFTLPKLDENQFMINQILEDLNLGQMTEKGEIKFNQSFDDKLEINIHYLEEFSLRLKEHSVSKFKYQLAGPMTLWHICANKSEVDQDEFYAYLFKTYSKLLNKLNQVGELLFFIDEPFLNNASDIEIERVSAFCSSLSKDSNAKVGIHCCAKLEKSQIEKCEVDYLNLDISLYSKEELSDLWEYIDAPGVSLEKFNLGEYRDFKIITPSCGLAFKEPEYCFEVFEIIKGSLE